MSDGKWLRRLRKDWPMWVLFLFMLALALIWAAPLLYMMGVLRNPRKPVKPGA